MLHGRPTADAGRVRVEAHLVAQDILPVRPRPGVAVVVAQVHGLAGSGVAVGLHAAHVLAPTVHGAIVALARILVGLVDDVADVVPALGDDLRPSSGALGLGGG